MYTENILEGVRSTKKAFTVLFGLTLLFTVATACGSSDNESVGTEEIIESAGSESPPYETEVTKEEIESLINLNDVSIPKGSEAKDLLKVLTYDVDVVNYASYNFNNIQWDEPGTYTVTATVNIPIGDASEYVSVDNAGEGTESVDLNTEFTVTITNEETVSESDEQTETSEETEPISEN